MEVIRKDKSETISFHFLAVGECFIKSSFADKVFLKIDMRDGINAVCLQTGGRYGFDIDDRVVHVEGIFTYE